ncbi:hypothetical protein JOL79_19260 [Microbispora sp. RL4-1S]|uniref:DUF8094 domain-containing protein n=1 Tax=Microbispora oryzae TaxID=2806554 RepID=A0A940WHR4_9ACTN|nr:hypothetical protein [Microbispora oryzae]MBP2705949.1 hypothetical protein [Microbispora oryzae]
MIGVVRSALALVLLGSAVACSGGSAAERRAASTSPATSAPSPRASASAGPSPSPGPDDQAVTPDEAREVLDGFLATDNVVRAGGADKWVLGLTRDGQRSMTIAEIHSEKSKPPVYTWAKRTVLVPRQSARRTVQWFAATAERRGGKGGPRTVVLTFIRIGRDGAWQNSFASPLYKGQRPPGVRLDADGYATALDARDTSVAISPNLMGPLHATVAEEGPQGYASGLIAPGPQTTGFFTEINKLKAKAKTSDCMTYESIFASAPNYPIFALRTADGGAMMLYTLLRTSSWSLLSSGASLGLKCGEGRPVPIPAAAGWLLGKGDVLIRERRQITETQQYVGAVPPKASTAPAHIIGYESVVTGASNR